MRNYPRLSFQEQYHILRHFSWIDKEYSKELIKNTGVTELEIDEQLALSGSKFFPEYAKNPYELWDLIITHPAFPEYFFRKWEKEKLVFELLYDKNKYSNGIGTNALINLKDLDPDETSGVEIFYRDRVALKRIMLKRIIPTWKICIIMGNEKNPFLITLFPGEYAPPLPDKENQNKQEYSENMIFWNEHVFNDNFK